MTGPKKPAIPTGDRPDDVLDEARDILRTVRLVLQSADTGLDNEDCCTLGYVMSQALDKLKRVHDVLSDGVLSTWDAATPKGKMVIPDTCADRENPNWMSAALAKRSAERNGRAGA